MDAGQWLRGNCCDEDRIVLRVKSPKVFPFAIALMAALALAACSRGGGTGAPAASSLTVTLTAAERRAVDREVVASGSVAAWQEMSLGVEVTGLRAANVLVEPGDKVVAGQALVELDRRTLEVQTRQAEASLAQARANAELAISQEKRGATLLDRNLISTNDFEVLRTNRARAEAQVASAQAEYDASKLRLGFATLRAPDNGIISTRNVQPGQIVVGGSELLRLIRRGRLEWRAEVSETDLTRIKVGSTVDLRGPSGERVSGVIRAVSPAIDPQTRTALVYADLEKPGALRAGMFAEGRLRVGKAEVTVIARQSVVFRDGYSYVFVLGEGGKVLQRRIDSGLPQGDFIEVRSGLREGEKVVARGAGFLSDGDIVKVVAGFSS
ncbi:MAG: efflux RND transporter periplasmic adaptor subunit [Gammaproteobacteria bacterium]|nr:efflux RND transporter periplasmic adaptor subunit [Gammaproteobacteria bacterium]